MFFFFFFFLHKPHFIWAWWLAPVTGQTSWGHPRAAGRGSDVAAAPPAPGPGGPRPRSCRRAASPWETDLGMWRSARVPAARRPPYSLAALSWRSCDPSSCWNLSEAGETEAFTPSKQLSAHYPRNPLSRKRDTRGHPLLRAAGARLWAPAFARCKPKRA